MLTNMDKLYESVAAIGTGLVLGAYAAWTGVVAA